MKKTGYIAMLSVATIGATGEAAAQCAMCGTALGGGDDPLRAAIGWSAAFLLAVPFTLVGSIGLWLYVAYRRALGAEATANLIPFRDRQGTLPGGNEEEEQR